jgi:hypothetical protein
MYCDERSEKKQLNLDDEFDLCGKKIRIVGYCNNGKLVRGHRTYSITVDNILHYVSDEIMDLLKGKSEMASEWKRLYSEAMKINEKKDKVIFELTNKLHQMEAGE